MGQMCPLTLGLGRRFGQRWAARDVGLAVQPGEIYGFVGKNGAGKTTVLRMIAGLLRPSEGRVVFEGRVTESRRALGFLPQSARLVEGATGAEVLAFLARLHGVDGARALERARRFDVDLGRPIRLLSPGEQRKLQIVIATFGEPRLLLLDEPTAGLDPTGIAQFRNMALECANEGSAVVVSSHVLSELDRLCRRVGIIDAGRLVFQGTVPSRVRVETSALDEATLATLRQQIGPIIRTDAAGLLLEIERERIPGAVRLLTQQAVDVFGVREEGLESFFYDTLGGSNSTGAHQQ